MMRRLLETVVRLLPAPRVIYDRGGTSPYLSRYYLVGPKPATTARGQALPADERVDGWQLYLHRFHRGDDDAALHNYPWAWAVSLVLAGGYVEERRLRQNYTLADTFHRVDLCNGECWTLFLVGPKVASWGFWDRLTDRYTPWRQFIAEIRGADWEKEVLPGGRVHQP